MKKLFFFAAAICAAVTASAINNGTYSFANVAKTSDFTITGAKANTGSTETKLVYDMETAGTAIVVTPTVLSSDIKFSIVHANEAKTKYFTVGLGDYFEFGGKGGVLEISNAPIGQTLTLHIANKSDKGEGSIALADCAGVSGPTTVALPAKTKEGYTYVDAAYTITAASVSIKENVYGYRIQSITIGAGTGLMETAAPAEVKKVIIDGKLYIRNAAGELVSVLGF